MFADISGYTALCEKCMSLGDYGNEFLAKHLNSYYELLVKIITSHGGDLLKYAGDACIVVWNPLLTKAASEPVETLSTLCRRACQCALDIKLKLQDATVAQTVTLNIKVSLKSSATETIASCA